MNEVINVLNEQVANWSVLYYKLHNFHWNVKGVHFYAFHELFEKFYDEAATYVDELAELALIKGGVPIGTLKAVLEISSIEEAIGNESPKEMLETIKTDFETIIAELSAGISIAEDAKDEVVVSALLDIKANLEKHVWMLGSTLY